MSLQEARRQAYVRFGGVEKYKEAARDARGRQWRRRDRARRPIRRSHARQASRADLRRWIRRWPWRSRYRRDVFRGHRRDAHARAASSATASAWSQSRFHRTSNPGSPAKRRVLRDFAVWRDLQLSSIEHLGAFRTAQHNFVSPNVPPEPVKVAEIDASGFAIARTPALLAPPSHRRVTRSQGAPSRPGDHGSSNVALTFRGRPDNSWTHTQPRRRASHRRRRHARRLQLSLRPPSLASPCAPIRCSYEQLQRAIALPVRSSGAWRHHSTRVAGRGEHALSSERWLAAVELRARVISPYTRAHVGHGNPALVWLFRIAQLLIGALSFVVAVNLAILTMYARTVTRLGEIAGRTALGASRRRVLSQLFIDRRCCCRRSALAPAVMLSHFASLAIQWKRRGPMAACRSGSGSICHSQPVVYAFALAVGAALIIGVLPGLKATAAAVVDLHELNCAGWNSLRPMWTPVSRTRRGDFARRRATRRGGGRAAGRRPSLLAGRRGWSCSGPGFAADRFVRQHVAPRDQTHPAGRSAVCQQRRGGSSISPPVSSPSRACRAVTFSRASLASRASPASSSIRSAPRSPPRSMPARLEGKPSTPRRSQPVRCLRRSTSSRDAGSMPAISRAATHVIVSDTFAQRFLALIAARWAFGFATSATEKHRSPRTTSSESFATFRDFPAPPGDRPG